MRHRDYDIAFFTNTYLPFVGGVSLSVDLYFRHLAETGVRVQLYAPTYEEEHDDSDRVIRLPAIRQFNQTDFSLPFPYAFKPITDFQERWFDVVHVHHPFLLGELGMRLAHQHRIPLVLTYHTQYERYTHYVPIDKETARETILRHTLEFCNHCDMIIAPTTDVRHDLRKRGVKAPIKVLPTGVELSKFENADTKAARRKLGIPADAPLLLHVGRLAKEKNLKFLLKACIGALEKVPDAHLAIVGSGDESEKLKRRATESPVADRIHIPGKIIGDDLRALYNAADLFVFTSKTETQGMVVMEAMAGATPVIVLDADGVRDHVKDSHNGRRLPGDASKEDFAAAVVDGLKDRNQLNQWSENAKQTARDLDMPVLAKRLQSIYRELKATPNHRLHQESINFGLIRNFFETVWDDIGKNWFNF